ncbi:MAG: ligase-associated DNA damage response exonuclease [Bacteroidota bacterium]
MSLLEFSENGIYCSKAGVHIDPWKPVDKALITHGHADHSRWGHRYYLSTESAMPVIKHRLGQDINIETISFGKICTINGVNFSFHPAGHIIGSAQIRVEYKGEVWVASGDYKTESDGISEHFETVKCHHFITESTFGLPVYKWKKQEAIFNDINQWWRANQEAGKVSVITGYSLGKAQRIIQNLDATIGKIFTHGAVENVNEVIREQGIDLQPTIRVSQDIDKKEYKGAIIVVPPSAVDSPWMKKFQPYSVGIASGWMGLRGARRRRSVDRGFVLSDHADWIGLNDAIKATGAENIYVTHGYTSIFAKWLREQGYNAKTVETLYEGELGEISEGSTQQEASNEAA